MTFGQSSVTGQQTKDASQTAHITKFFIAEPAAGSGYETGPLHIIYSDGTEIVQTLPPLKHSRDEESVFNAVDVLVTGEPREWETVEYVANAVT